MSRRVDPIPPYIEKGTYRHSKTGRLYEVIGVAMHTETQEFVVVYKPLYESQRELYVRPYAMFIEQVEIAGELRPRFELVK